MMSGLIFEKVTRAGQISEGDPQRRQINFITDAIAEKIAKEKRKAK